MVMKKEFMRERFGRGSFFILAVIFAACIVIQVFIAGLSIFVSPVNWMNHTMFVHLFGMNLPLLLFVTALIGKIPKWAYLHTFGLLVFIFAMYFTANITDNIPWAGALHPILAMILFMQSAVMVMNSWKMIVKKQVIEGVE